MDFLELNIKYKNEFYADKTCKNLENYVLSEKETTNMFIMAVNAAIDKSYNLFKRLIEMYTEYESRSEITNKMLESNLVSDRNKDIILLDYLNNTL